MVSAMVGSGNRDRDENLRGPHCRVPLDVGRMRATWPGHWTSVSHIADSTPRDENRADGHGAWHDDAETKGWDHEAWAVSNKR